MDQQAPDANPQGPDVDNSTQNTNSSSSIRSRRRRINEARPQGHRQRRGVNRTNIRSREGFFMHYLFITLSMRYATYFKPTARRLIEFFTLIKAIVMLLLLIYVHITFVKESGNCLEHVDSIWPRTGVLKVQVEANSSLPPYQFFFEKPNTDNWAASFYASPYHAVLKYSVPLGPDGLPEQKLNFTQPQTAYNAKRVAREILGIDNSKQCPAFNLSATKEHARRLLSERFAAIQPEIEFLSMIKEDYPTWILEDPSISDSEVEKKMVQMQEMSGFNIGPQPVRSYYAIEYSSEFGYLRLSALTRHMLGIPVLVVTLDPKHDHCFGKGVKRWMMDTFFGYDDLIMGSIKHLAEKNNKQGGGYLRNLVTGEHYKFITLWVSQASYLLAFAVMLVFTLVVTMLLRYSYHQIFVFMVELLHILDMDATPVFPAAPMLTIILALVGTEEIMTEFFHDSTLAFYVILSIWVADQFDAICMHTIISRRHWVRFFFLYHFAFYAYHYRFNGQFSELALFTSWLFIQHSMFYFFHHYELPAIQRQIRLRQVILQNGRQNSPPAPPTPREPAAPSPGPDSDNTTSSEHSSQDPASASSDSDRPGPSGVSHNPETMDNNQTSEGESLSIQHEASVVNTGLDRMDNAPMVETVDNILSLPLHEEEDTPNLPLDSEEDPAIWADDFKSSFHNDSVSEIEAGMSHGQIRIFKYCNLIVFLFFTIVALILVFAFAIILLNQGRIGARFGTRGLDNVAGLVR